MQAVVEEIGPCKKLLKITVPSERVSEQVKKSFQDIVQSSYFPGFRRGHVPRRLIERKYGDQIYKEIKRDLIVSSIEEAIEQNKLTPLGDPEFDIEKIPFTPEGPLYFEIAVEVRPDFELPSYKGMHVFKEPVSISEQEVEHALRSLARNRANLEPLEAAQATVNDLVIADCEVLRGEQSIARQEGVQFIPAEGRVLGLKVPELAATFVGPKSVEPAEFDVELPKGVELGGQKGGVVRLKISPTEVKRLKLPSIDDRWAKDMDFDSLDDLRNHLKAQVQQSKERDAWREAEERILDQILEKTAFDVPKGLVEREMNRAFHRARLQMQMDGLSEEAILERLEAQRDRREEEMERAFKKGFILERIAEKEHLFVSEERVNEAIASIAESYGKWPNEVRAHFEENRLLPQLRVELRERLTREFLRQCATVEERSVPRVR